MNVKQTYAACNWVTAHIETERLAQHALKFAMETAKLAGGDNVNYRLSQYRQFLLLKRKLNEVEQLMFPPDKPETWVCK